MECVAQTCECLSVLVIVFPCQKSHATSGNYEEGFGKERYKNKWNGSSAPNEAPSLQEVKDTENGDEPHPGN